MGPIIYTLTALFAALTIFSEPVQAQRSGPTKWEQREADCATRPTPSEREICLDRDLTRKDGVLNEVYQDVRRRLSSSDFAILRDEQRDWLRERNTCGSNTRCLADAYTDRIALLEQLLENVDNPGKSHVEIGCDGPGQTFIDGECRTNYAGASRNEPKLHPTCSLWGTVRSLESRTPLTVTFTNTSDGYRGVMWLNFEGTPVEYTNLEQGQSYTVTTYLTHPWMFTDGPGNCMQIYVPKPGDTRFEISAPSPAFGPGND